MELGHVNVCLLLAGSNGGLHLTAVGIDDGIAGILPSLVLGALRGARLVFVKTIVIEISSFIFPS